MKTLSLQSALTLFLCFYYIFSAYAQNNPNQMEETIVVTGTKTNQNVENALISTEVIKAQDEENISYDNLEDLLQNTSSIQLNPSALGTDLNIQGLTSKHVLVLIDGERVPGKIGEKYDLSQISTHNIEQVEIIKGPTSTLYGADAMGGVINLRTRSLSNTKNSHHITSTVGNLGHYHVGAKAIFGTRKWRNSLSMSHKHFDSVNLTPEDQTTTTPERKQFSLASKIHLNMPGKHQLTLKHSYAKNKSEGLKEQQKLIFDQKKLTEIFSSGIIHQKRFSTDSDFKLSLHHTHFKDQFLEDNKDTVSQDKYEITREDRLSVKLQGNFTAKDYMLFAIGLENKFEQFSSPRVSGTQKKNQVGVFLQNEIFFNEKLTILPGVRYDYDSFNSNNQVTPKVAFRYDLNEKVFFRSSYGRGYRNPEFKNLFMDFENSVGATTYAVKGNPNLKPESSKGFNADANFHLHRDLRFNVGVFHHKINNLIDFQTVKSTGNNFLFTYMNVNKAKSQGVESHISVGTPLDQTITLSHTFTSSKDYDKGGSLPGIPSHQASFKLSQHFRNLKTKIFWHTKYIGKRTLYVGSSQFSLSNNSTSEVAKAYFISNLNMNVDINKKTRFFASINNLFNAGDPKTHPLTPQFYQMGMKLIF